MARPLAANFVKGLNGVLVEDHRADCRVDFVADLGMHATSEERRGAHAKNGELVTGIPRGAHVKQGDPLLSIEARALHAVAVGTPATIDLTSCALEEVRPLVASNRSGRSEPSPRSRASRTRRGPRGLRGSAGGRWRLVAGAGAAGALAVGMGAGSGFAYLQGHGSGSGATQIATGSPITVSVSAQTGTSDLLPGRAGSVYFTVRNATSLGVTLDHVNPGATVVSDNADLCASSNVSIAPPLPYALPTAMSVGPNSASGTQSIADFVKLAPDAPGTCQGVTFTVNLILTGQSS